MLVFWFPLQNFLHFSLEYGHLGVFWSRTDVTTTPVVGLLKADPFFASLAPSVLTLQHLICFVQYSVSIQYKYLLSKFLLFFVLVNLAFLSVIMLVCFDVCFQGTINKICSSSFPLTLQPQIHYFLSWDLVCYILTGTQIKYVSSLLKRDVQLREVNRVGMFLYTFV